MVSEYFFENPEVFAIAIGVLIFVVMYGLISKKFDKGISLMISLAVSGMASWGLYKNDFYGYEMVFVYLMYVVVVLVMIRMFIWPFIKNFNR